MFDIISLVLFLEGVIHWCTGFLSTSEFGCFLFDILFCNESFWWSELVVAVIIKDKRFCFELEIFLVFFEV